MNKALKTKLKVVHALVGLMSFLWGEQILSWPFCSNLTHKCQYMDVFPPRLFIYSREKSFDLLPREADSRLVFWEPLPFTSVFQCVCFLSLQPLLHFSWINLLPAWRGVCGIQSGLATRSGLGNSVFHHVSSPYLAWNLCFQGPNCWVFQASWLWSE